MVVNKTFGKIFCMGSIIMDVSIKCKEFPLVGETVYTPYFYEISPGGKGGNQATAAARMGGNVRILGRISDDTYGNELKINMQKNGIDISKLRIDSNEKSGVAFVWINEAGYNRIICSPAVNKKLSMEDIDNGLVDFEAGDILLATLESDLELLKYTFEKVKEKSGIIILDPSADKKNETYLSIMGMVDIIKPNEIEAEMLTGITINGEDEAKKALEVLNKMGIKYPIISLGAKGLVYMKNNKVFHEQGIPVNAIDTTAAGDTFIGTLACEISKRKNLDDAVKIANKAAAICVQRMGAQKAIPYATEI